MKVFVVPCIDMGPYNDTFDVFGTNIMVKFTLSYSFTDMMRSNEIFDLSCHIYFEEY